MKWFLISAIALLTLGFTVSKIQKKVIRNKEFDIHFYVSLKNKEAQKDRMYYWYKAGEIHKSQGATGGDLLHSEYQKYFKGYQLAEKGDFKYGLKTGTWKQWYPEGTLKTEESWSNGLLDGAYKGYDETGTLISSGKYRKGIKNGMWLNFKTKDTLWYDKGIAYQEPPRIVKKRMDSLAGKKPFMKRVLKPFKKIFRKKKNEEGQELEENSKQTKKDND
ncbi:MAG: hypothetical protein KTR22_08030 [Flavobacteriaceae bacterium]|nr:hypothetical protein [Flavobacteriaceae bacterium]